MPLSVLKVLELLTTYKYAVILPLLVFEGPITSIVGGSLSTVGIFNIYILFITCVGADLLADLLYFSLGRWGRKSIVSGWLKSFSPSPYSIEKAETYFNKYGVLAIVVGKFTSGLSIPVLFMSGLSKMRIVKFASVAISVSIPKTVILLSIGYFIGEQYEKIQNVHNRLSQISILLLAFAVLSLLVIKRLRKNHNSLR